MPRSRAVFSLPTAPTRLACRLVDQLKRNLLDAYQRGFPVSPTPYKDVADELGVSEDQLLDAIKELKESGVLSRVGPVFKPKSVGDSTLAAMAVPSERLEEVAELVSGFSEVNHNYEREHRFNLWFVVTAADTAQVEAVISEISEAAGLEVLNLPMLADFHLDLGFALQWN